MPGQRAGGGQYAYQLARGLAAVDRKNTYLLYPTFYYIVHPEHRLAQLPEARNMRTALRWLPPAVASYLWRVDHPDAFKERLLGGVDLVHSTTYCAPLFRSRRKRLVVTIYDLTFVTHPEYHLPANVAHCLEGTRLAIERADMLIAISESVRRDLIERMHAPAERIVVTPLPRTRGSRASLTPRSSTEPGGATACPSASCSSWVPWSRARTCCA